MGQIGGLIETEDRELDRWIDRPVERTSLITRNRDS